MASDEVEKYVTTPELYKENSITAEPLPPGQVWSMSPGDTDGDPQGLFRIEVASSQGSGTHILNKPAPIPFKERCGWPLLWIVDPLDGTKEFIARNGEFTVNIALVENHRVVLGIIFVPVLCCLYVGFESTARKYVVPGWLQQRDDHFLRNSTFVELPSRKDKLLTAVDSISHPNEAGKHYISRVRQLTGAIDVCSVGSSLKFCLLAEGEAHLYPRYGHIMEWDTAAGQAIVEASGGSVLTLPGMEPMFYNREDLRNPHFIAIGAGVERQLVAVAGQ